MIQLGALQVAPPNMPQPQILLDAIGVATVVRDEAAIGFDLFNGSCETRYTRS